MDTRGAVFAAAAMVLVGASVAAASVLGGYPVLGGQAARYAVAALLLYGWVLLTKKRIPKPSARDMAWLAGVALVGMALFNVFLILSTDRIDPSLVGAIIGVTPILLAIGGALQLGRRPQTRLVVAAVIVSIGTALVVQARVETDALGFTLAIGVLLCEVGFSLFAVPVLRTIGPVGVSLHSMWMAALMLMAGAVVFDGTAALRWPTTTELWALVYLAVMVTAVAFVLWYASVDRLGAETAGLYAGLIPIAALVTSAGLGTETITPRKLTGVVVVGLGVAYGMRASRDAAADG